MRGAGLREYSTVLLALAGFLPTLITILFLALRSQNDLPALAALTVLLPRLFMILNHTTSLIHQLRDIPIFRARARELSNAMELGPDRSFRSRMDLEKISMVDNKTGLVISMTDPLPKKGWLTIRGANGSGKSSWLAELKKKLGDDAFYYPAHSDLLFERDSQPRSTGQRALSELELILTRATEPILLLDEWDANLDSARQTTFAERLKVEGERRLVIDVRH